MIIIPKNQIIEAGNAASKDDALIDFATTMDSDMGVYFQAEDSILKPAEDNTFAATFLNPSLFRFSIHEIEVIRDGRGYWSLQCEICSLPQSCSIQLACVIGTYEDALEHLKEILISGTVQKPTPAEFTLELCPYCGNEQVIFSKGVTACPDCGKPLVPCSECSSCNYNFCPYGCNGTAHDDTIPVTERPITPQERQQYMAAVEAEIMEQEHIFAEENYTEFLDKKAMSNLIYWSNGCGDLYCGDKDIPEEELPPELQRAFRDLWEEGNGCYEYLAEYEGTYYIALVSEFSWDFARDCGIKFTSGMYKIAKENALALHSTPLFPNTKLILGKNTGFEACHEVIFLVPAMEKKEIYDKIEKEISDHIFKV